MDLLLSAVVPFGHRPRCYATVESMAEDGGVGLTAWRHLVGGDALAGVSDGTESIIGLFES